MPAFGDAQFAGLSAEARAGHRRPRFARPELNSYPWLRTEAMLCRRSIRRGGSLRLNFPFFSYPV
jgi:hypothetical protein